ncbi:hypothetical protein I5535_12675 [Rhodobacteraceae bacterium F11138]|nr:hypothetical protein [Rhodobacteraceae bacterium F11138]
MTEIVIRIPVSDDIAPLFEGKAIMVMPLSDEEADQLPAALSQVSKTFEINCKSLATLDQVLETRGSDEPDIAKTLNMLKAPNRNAVGFMGFVQKLFRRSVLLGLHKTEKRLQ